MDTKSNFSAAARLLTVGVMASLLGACASQTVSRNASVVISDAENAKRTIAIEGEDVADALAAGKTLTARSVAASTLYRDYDEDTTQLYENLTVSLRRIPGTDNIELVFDGLTHVFTSADISESENGYIFDNDDFYLSLYNYQGKITELLNSSDEYARVIRIHASDLPGFEDGSMTTYSVIGTETADSVLPSLATATYKGSFRADAYSAAGYSSYQEDVSTLRGDLTMTANFGAGEISGSIDSLRLRAPEAEREEGEGFLDIAGAIAMNPTGFDANGFSGTLTADASLESSLGSTIEDGTYSGAFYGPNAETVAGAISARAVTEEGGLNAIGFFNGNQ